MARTAIIIIDVVVLVAKGGIGDSNVLWARGNGGDEDVGWEAAIISNNDCLLVKGSSHQQQ